MDDEPLRKQAQNFTDKILANFKNKRIVAYAIVVAIILGGIGGAASNLEKIVSFAASMARNSNPAVLQLVPAFPFYKESEKFPFAIGPQTIKTFSPDEYYLGKIDSFHPIFQISLENRGQSEMLVSKINFHVSEVGQVMLGASGPLEPTYEYHFTLGHHTGLQTLNMVPPFRVDKRSIGSFALELSTDEPDLGLAWIMKVEFVTNHGSAWTDQFQLIMSGRPHWMSRGGRRGPDG